MNKPKILYCVQQGKAEHLELLGDFPGKPNCLLYRSQEDGELIPIFQVDLKESKHMYFTNRNNALHACIKWHEAEVSKLWHRINEQIPAHGHGK